MTHRIAGTARTGFGAENSIRKNAAAWAVVSKGRVLQAALLAWLAQARLTPHSAAPATLSRTEASCHLIHFVRELFPARLLMVGKVQSSVLEVVGSPRHRKYSYWAALKSNR